MPELERRYTVRDLDAFPNDGKKYELIRGELVVSSAPSMVHQMVITRLAVQLAGYLAPIGKLDGLIAGPADISWDDATLVQPDLLVLRPEELSGSWSTAKRLRLAVEVLSPSSGRRDRLDKRTLYQENQVETYWIVDPDAQLVEEWHPGDERPLIVADHLRWRVTPEATMCEIEVEALFRGLPPVA